MYYYTFMTLPLRFCVDDPKGEITQDTEAEIQVFPQGSTEQREENEQQIAVKKHSGWNPEDSTQKEEEKRSANSCEQNILG